VVLTGSDCEVAGGGRILEDWKRDAGSGKEEATGRKFAPKEVGRMRSCVR